MSDHQDKKENPSFNLSLSISTSSFFLEPPVTSSSAGVNPTSSSVVSGYITTPQSLIQDTTSPLSSSSLGGSSLPSRGQSLHLIPKLLSNKSSTLGANNLEMTPEREEKSRIDPKSTKRVSPLKNFEDDSHQIPQEMIGIYKNIDFDTSETSDSNPFDRSSKQIPLKGESSKASCVPLRESQSSSQNLSSKEKDQSSSGLSTPPVHFNPDLLKKRLLSIQTVATEAVRFDNQQLYVHALEKYKIAIDELSDILCQAARYERKQRVKSGPLTRKRMILQNTRQGDDLKVLPTKISKLTTPSMQLLQLYSQFESNQTISIPQAPATSSLSLPPVCLTIEEKDMIIDVRDRYIERVNGLLSVLPNTVSFQYGTSITPQNDSYFTKKRPPVIPPHYRPVSYDTVFLNVMRSDPSQRLAGLRDLSSDSVLRSLELWTRFAKTMVDGSFLGPNLYVPIDIWTQPGGKIHALDFKLAALSSILPSLKRLADFDPVSASANAKNVLKSFDELQLSIESARHSLLKKFRFLSTLEEEKEKQSEIQFPSTPGGFHGSLLSQMSGAGVPQLGVGSSLGMGNSTSNMFSGSSKESSASARILSWGVHKFQKGIEKIKSRTQVSSSTNDLASHHSAKSPLLGGASSSQPPSGHVSTKKGLSCFKYRNFMLQFLRDWIKCIWTWYAPILALTLSSESLVQTAHPITLLHDYLSTIIPLDPGTFSLARLKEIGQNLPSSPHIRHRIHKYVEFFDTIVCPLLLHDMSGLFEILYKKMRKITSE